MNFNYLFLLVIVCNGCSNDRWAQENKAISEFSNEINRDLTTNDVVIIESTFQCSGCVDSLFSLIKNNHLLCPKMEWTIILSNDRHIQVLESIQNTSIFYDEKGVLEKYFPKLAGLTMIRMSDKKVSNIEPLGIKELIPNQLQLKFDEVYSINCGH